MSNTLTIGQLARLGGVGVETIRFYERERLIAEPARRASGYRQYLPEDVDRIHFIRRAKELGFTLREIRELLELRLDPSATCGSVKLRAQAKVEDIDNRMADLARMKAALCKLVKACEQRRAGVAVSACPILDALDESKNASK